MVWRDTIVIHPEADEFPLLDKGELQELANDIKENGLKNLIAVAVKGADTILVDGRNRLDAIELNGEPIFDKKGQLLKKLYTKVALPDASAYIRSANLHRRHLTKDEKLQLAAKMLETTPEMSNRAIGERVKLHHETVAKLRSAKEASGEIRHIKHPKARKTSNPRKPTAPSDPNAVRTASGDAIDLTKATEKVKAQLDAAKYGFDKMNAAELQEYGEKLRGKMIDEEFTAWRAACSALIEGAAAATVQAETASPPIAQEEPEPGIPERALTPEELSDDALTAFKEACAKHCPVMNAADLKAARVYLNGNDGAGRGTWAPRVVRKAA